MDLRQPDTWRSGWSRLSGGSSRYLPQISHHPDCVFDSCAVHFGVVRIRVGAGFCPAGPDMDQPPASCDLCVLLCPCPHNHQVHVRAPSLLNGLRNHLDDVSQKRASEIARCSNVEMPHTQHLVDLGIGKFTILDECGFKCVSLCCGASKARQHYQPNAGD